MELHAVLFAEEKFLDNYMGLDNTILPFWVVTNLNLGWYIQSSPAHEGLIKLN